MSHDKPPGGGGGGGGGGACAGGTEKADRHLRRALDDAAPEEELQAIVTVKGAATPGGPPGGTSGEGAGAAPVEPEPAAPPHPGDFPDRVAYRQAMIEHHGRNPRARVGAAKEALEKLGLTTRGEGHAGLLIVQGPARRLADALELEAVERVALDRQVETQDESGGAPDGEAEAEAGGADALGLPPGGSGSKG